MLKLGEKGAIPQRDNETYAIAPHIPCGLVTPELLRRIADTAEKFNAKAIKITGATRIAIIGLKEEDIDGAWDSAAPRQRCRRGLVRSQYKNLSGKHLLQAGPAGCHKNRVETGRNLSCQAVAGQI